MKFLNQDSAGIALRELIEKYRIREIQDRELKEKAYQIIKTHYTMFLLIDNSPTANVLRRVGVKRLRILNDVLKDTEIHFNVSDSKKQLKKRRKKRFNIEY